MSNDLPWFPLYVGDFLGDEAVKLASNRALGAYIKLLCHQWAHRSVPSDTRQLARLVNESDEDFRELWAELEGKFQYRDGRLQNRRLEVVRREQDRVIRAKRRGARTANALRADSGRTPGVKPEPDVEPDTEPKTTKSKALVHLDTGSVEAQTQRRQTVEATLRLATDTVFAYWQAKLGHPQAILDRQRRARLEARLRENGGDVSELLYAIDGALRDDWIMGRDPKAQRRYDGIETIFRDRGQVERFVATVPGRNGQHPFLAQPVPGAA